MPDILNDFPIKAPAADVFRAVSTPEGLDQWWTKRSSGIPVLGTEYELWFGPEYDWRARLADGSGATQVRFTHRGWPEASDHYRISCYCWPMYLRILRRYLEYGEAVPYERRLDV